MLARAVVLALLAAADAAAPDPCRAARAPLPPTVKLSGGQRKAVDAYRLSWRRACDPKAVGVDLAGLFGDADALVADVSTSRAIEAVAGAATGGEWPLPGIQRDEDALGVDWAAFVALADRAAAEDGKFWRGAARVADRRGEPGWLGDPIPGGAARCVRLGEVRWAEVADALDEMERAGTGTYVRLARELRTRLVETLAAVARGPETCACLKGDAAAGLEPLAAAAETARLGTPARRALAKAAADAFAALRSGRARVRFLRDAPDAPAIGCGAVR